MDKHGVSFFKIPLRSPDYNPIENYFSIITEVFKNDAINKNITKENYEDFVQSVQDMMLNFPCLDIDAIIETMHKRILTAKNTKEDV